MYIYKLSGIVRAAAKEGRKVVEGVLLPHRGVGVGLRRGGGAICVTSNTSLHGPLQMQSHFISHNQHRATG